MFILFPLFKQLSVQARDKGTPQLSSTSLATVTVTVLRNRNCPTFTPSVVDIAIDQSTNSRVVYDANATDPDAAVSKVHIIHNKMNMQYFSLLNQRCDFVF